MSSSIVDVVAQLIDQAAIALQAAGQPGFNSLFGELYSLVAGACAVYLSWLLVQLIAGRSSAAQQLHRVVGAIFGAMLFGAIAAAGPYQLVDTYVQATTGVGVEIGATIAGST